MSVRTRIDLYEGDPAPADFQYLDLFLADQARVRVGWEVTPRDGATLGEGDLYVDLYEVGDQPDSGRHLGHWESGADAPPEIVVDPLWADTLSVVAVRGKSSTTEFGLRVWAIAAT